MSDLNLKIEPTTKPTPVLRQSLSIDSRLSGESVIRGIIGAMFTPHLIPASLNFSMTENKECTGGVPGSMMRLIASFEVVMDHTIKQLSLYCL
jgi:hypothetical protein